MDSSSTELEDTGTSLWNVVDSFITVLLSYPSLNCMKACFISAHVWWPIEQVSLGIVPGTVEYLRLLKEMYSYYPAPNPAQDVV